MIGRFALLGILAVLVPVSLAQELPALSPTAKSAACMQCHGGLSGPEIGRHATHKVDVDYDRLQPHSSAGLRPSSAKTPFGGTVREKLLVDGKVECSSCHYTHEEFTETSFRLRMANGSYVGLCTSCHDMGRL